MPVNSTYRSPWCAAGSLVNPATEWQAPNEPTIGDVLTKVVRDLAGAVRLNKDGGRPDGALPHWPLSLSDACQASTLGI
jgi:hypothetical protein